MKKIFIAGCGGMLGEAFYKVYSDEYELKCTDIDVNTNWLEYLDFRESNSYEIDVIKFKADYLFHIGAFTDLEYCEDLKEFFGPIKPRKIFVDPSAASFKVQMKRSSFMGINDADNDVVNGIMTHSRMLKSGEFAVSSDCKNSIREYQSYVWDEKAQDKGEDKPKKDNDHSMDQIRYLLHSLFGEDHLDYSKLVTW